jgi:hypothetical protein
MLVSRQLGSCGPNSLASNAAVCERLVWVPFSQVLRVFGCLEGDGPRFLAIVYPRRMLFLKCCGLSTIQ